jgi:hypothetical protein
MNRTSPEGNKGGVTHQRLLGLQACFSRAILLHDPKLAKLPLSSTQVRPVGLRD